MPYFIDSQGGGEGRYGAQALKQMIVKFLKMLQKCSTKIIHSFDTLGTTSEYRLSENSVQNIHQPIVSLSCDKRTTVSLGKHRQLSRSNEQNLLIEQKYHISVSFRCFKKEVIISLRVNQSYISTNIFLQILFSFLVPISMQHQYFYGIVFRTI
jgi:hypothetical protein